MWSGLLQIVPYGFCQCGCGEKTTVPKYGKTRADGVRAGVPRIFRQHHHMHIPSACKLTERERQALATKRHYAKRDPAYFADYYRANKQQLLAKVRAKRAADPVVRQRHRDEVRRRHQRDPTGTLLRGWRRRGTVIGPHVAQYVTVIASDPCAYCGAPAAEADHIVPIAHGGMSEWTNLTASCVTCNRRKHTKSLLHFLLS